MSTNTYSNEPLLKVNISHDVLNIHLCDPLSKNALSLQMAEQIDKAISKNKFNAVLLTHEGDFYCSGGHLKNYQELKTKEEGLQFNRQISEILNKLSNHRVPKACVVDGLCLGGGIELLSCFDYVVATPKSLLGLWQRRMGLTFGWGGQDRLLKKISANDLQNWLISGNTISSYQAQKLGLINKVSLSCHTRSDCLSWLQNALHWGQESLSEILNEKQVPEKAFSNLWLGETHMTALKKFK